MALSNFVPVFDSPAALSKLNVAQLQKVCTMEEKMKCYYLVNVREYIEGISCCVYRQPFLDDMDLPNFTYVYDIDSESDDLKVIFCHLRGFFGLDQALTYVDSLKDCKKKVSLFLRFKSAFFDLDD